MKKEKIRGGRVERRNRRKIRIIFSCPAVSQISNLMVVSSKERVCVRKAAGWEEEEEKKKKEKKRKKKKEKRKKKKEESFFGYHSLLKFTAFT